MESFSLRIQDIFRIFIPGVVLFAFVLFRFITFFAQEDLNNFKDFENILLIIFVIFCLFIGYFIDLVSSLLEQLLYKIIKKPSYHLINGTKLTKYCFSEYILHENLIEKVNETFNFKLRKESNQSLSRRKKKCISLIYKVNTNSLYNKNETTIFFNFCNRLKENNSATKSYEKLNSYLYSKILSRNITVTILLILIFELYIESYTSYIFLIILLLFSFYRWLKLSLNYTRQVFILCENNIQE